MADQELRAAVFSAMCSAYDDVYETVIDEIMAIVRVRLAEVEAERDGIAAYNDKRYHDCTKVQDGLREARARLAEVEADHAATVRQVDDRWAARLTEVEAERDEQRARADRLVADLNRANDRYVAAEARLAEVEAERDRLDLAHLAVAAKLRARLAEVEAERDSWRDECQHMETVLDEHKEMSDRLAEVEALCDRMRAIHKDCPPSWVDAVLAVARGEVGRG